MLHYYPHDWNEMTREEQRELVDWALEQDTKARNTYPEGEEVKLCSRCHFALVYNSVSYYEGWHFDTCY